MKKIIRIGTRESQLAVWQATCVKELLSVKGYKTELVFITTAGDEDLKTPLYEMGVQGIFTRSLDSALLNDKIDIAVHSMKDVPVKLPEGIRQCSVLTRGPVHDLLVYKNHSTPNQHWSSLYNQQFHIATSSIRRMAQWLNKFPNHHIHNLRGNVNTRLKKLNEQNWDAAIFAQAGLERIALRPPNSKVIDWMLPAPAQGAILVVCRNDDHYSFSACSSFNDRITALCTMLERDFLKALLGGCSTPISALAELKGNHIHFKGNILSPDGKEKIEVEKHVLVDNCSDTGKQCAEEIIKNNGQRILDRIRYEAY